MSTADQKCQRRSTRVALVAAGLVTLYALAYIVISRRGYAQADTYGVEGFYYVLPENTDEWRVSNRACAIIFYPANAIDRWTGVGRVPACEPLFDVN
jgi:hypothetical protein